MFSSTDEITAASEPPKELSEKTRKNIERQYVFIPYPPFSLICHYALNQIVCLLPCKFTASKLKKQGEGETSRSDLTRNPSDKAEAGDGIKC